MPRRHAGHARRAASPADLAIRDGRIAARPRAGHAGRRRLATIDATGRHVLPGAIDVHSHHREPGYTHKEDIVTATSRVRGRRRHDVLRDAQRRAAAEHRRAAGRDARAVRRAGDRRLEHQRRPGTVPEHIAELATMGIAAFKVFMVVDTGRYYPHMPGIGVHHHGKLLEIFEAVGPTGLPLMVHPHDQELMDHIEARLLGARRARLPRLRQGLRRARRHHLGHRGGAAAPPPAARPARRSTCCTPRPGASSTRSARPRRAASGVSAELNPWAVFLGQRLGDHRAARLVRAVATGCPRRTPSRCGRRCATAPSTSSRPTTRPTRARRRSRAGPTAGRPTRARRRPSSTCRCSSTPAARPHQPRARRGAASPTAAGARASGWPRRGGSRSGADADIAIVDLDTRAGRSATRQVLSARSAGRPTPGRRVRGRRSTARWSAAGRLRGRSGHGRSPAGAARPRPADAIRHLPHRASTDERRHGPRWHPLRPARPPLRRGGRPGPAHRGRPAGRAARLRLDLGPRPPRLPPARDGGHRPDVHRAVHHARPSWPA